VNRVAELLASPRVGCSVLLGIVVGFTVWCLLERLFFYKTQESHQSKDSFFQSLCSKTEGKDAWLTRVADWLQLLWIPLWLFAYGDKEMWPMMLQLLQYLALGIVLSVFLALYETIRKSDSYKKRARTTPNVKAEP
jgi:ABC-type phosphate/phosphonate transport system permease subunit